MAELLNGDPRGSLKTSLPSLSPLDSRQKIYIEEGEEVTVDLLNSLNINYYPHLRIHAHKKIKDTDGTYINEICVGVYEIDDLEVTYKFGSIRSVKVKAFHQVYSTASGLESDYFNKSGNTDKTLNYNEKYKNIIFYTDTNKVYLNGASYGGGGDIEDGSIGEAKLSNEVKAKLSNIDTINNTINASNPPVCKPSITVSWEFYKKDGTTKLTSVPNVGNANSPIIEKGIKAKYTATYKWVSATGYQNPKGVSTTIINWQTLPADNTDSTSAINTVSSATTLKVTLQAPKVGLIVKNNSVVPVSATDMITSEASVSVNFYNRIYYGKISEDSGNNITEDVLKGLSTSLVATNVLDTTVNISDSEYYVFASTSQLSSIAQPNSPNEIGAFTRTEVNVTNVAGETYKYYVYRSNNTGAYKNVNLIFK